MKNLIKFCVIFLTASVFLSSCGSSLSITKRQHSKGYFVSYSKKYSASPDKESSTDKNEQVKNQVAEVEKAKDAQEPNDGAEANTSLNSEESKGLKKTLKEESTIDLTETSTVASKKTEQPRTIKTAKNNVKSTVSPMENRDRGEGYSLLWVIIIVLLVLWALGLIGGFGSTGLLHLLLVIALILLILWLLRVI